MSAAERIPASGVLFDYRGCRYEQHHLDSDWPYDRIVALEPGWNRADWPGAAEFGEDPDDPWVRIGAGAFDAAWTRTVHARWRGCEVLVGEFVRHGTDRGKVTVHYVGTDPAEADAAGFIGSSYQHWHSVTDPEHVQVTKVDVQPLEDV